MCSRQHRCMRDVFALKRNASAIILNMLKIQRFVIPTVKKGYYVRKTYVKKN